VAKAAVPSWTAAFVEFVDRGLRRVRGKDMDPYSPEGLIAVADGSPAEVVTRLAALDPVRVLAAPLTEVGSRASVVLGPPHPVPVQFDLGLPGGGPRRQRRARPPQPRGDREGRQHRAGRPGLDQGRRRSVAAAQ
jgi:hypothetical protein